MPRSRSHSRGPTPRTRARAPRCRSAWRTGGRRARARAQLQVVVDLAVLHDDDRAVLVRDRLVAAGQVDDREPPRGEPDAALDVHALGVRPAVHERRRHAPEPLRVHGSRARRRFRRCRTSASGRSERAERLADDAHRGEHDRAQVQAHRSVGDPLEVVRELLRHRGLVAAPVLGEPGQAGPDDEPLPVRRQLAGQLREEAGPDRSGADERHIAADHVPELGDLSSCDAFRKRPIRSARLRCADELLAQVLTDTFFGAAAQRPELEHLEEASAAADAAPRRGRGGPSSPARRARARARPEAGARRTRARAAGRACAARRRSDDEASRPRAASSRARACPRGEAAPLSRVDGRPWGLTISAIDHVQVAAPPGCEGPARAFYGALLGLEELAEAGRARGRAAAAGSGWVGRSCTSGSRSRSRPPGRRIRASSSTTSQSSPRAGSPRGRGFAPPCARRRRVPGRRTPSHAR